MSDPLVIAVMEESLRTAKEKIAFGKQTIGHELKDTDATIFENAAAMFYVAFQGIFRSILPHELEYEEMLSLANEQLQRVYDEFGNAMESDG